MGVEKYKNGFILTLHPSTLRDPFKWKDGSSVFIPSMGDLFHKDVPDSFIEKVFETMRENNRLNFYLITKRAERLLAFSERFEVPSNVCVGVTVESQKYIYRIDLLKKIHATRKFVNMEPLLSDINDINLFGIDFVSVGGESGPIARKMELSWVLNIRNQCLKQNVYFSFKQRGKSNDTRKEMEKNIENEWIERQVQK